MAAKPPSELEGRSRSSKCRERLIDDSTKKLDTLEDTKESSAPGVVDRSNIRSDLSVARTRITSERRPADKVLETFIVAGEELREALQTSDKELLSYRHFGVICRSLAHMLLSFAEETDHLAEEKELVEKQKAAAEQQRGYIFRNELAAMQKELEIQAKNADVDKKLIKDLQTQVQRLNSALQIHGIRGIGDRDFVNGIDNVNGDEQDVRPQSNPDHSASPKAKEVAKPRHSRDAEEEDDDEDCAMDFDGDDSDEGYADGEVPEIGLKVGPKDKAPSMANADAQAVAKPNASSSSESSKSNPVEEKEGRQPARGTGMAWVSGLAKALSCAVVMAVKANSSTTSSAAASEATTIWSPPEHVPSAAAGAHWNLVTLDDRIIPCEELLTGCDVDPLDENFLIE